MTLLTMESQNNVCLSIMPIHKFFNTSELLMLSVTELGKLTLHFLKNFLLLFYHLDKIQTLFKCKDL